MDFTPIVVVASSEFCLSPDMLFPVGLWVYGIDYRTTVTMARPRLVKVMVRLQNTVSQVLGFLRKYLPCTRDLHVVLYGQTLPREATIGQLHLPRDAKLHVTPHPKAWDLAIQIAAAAIYTFPVPVKYSKIVDNYHKSGVTGVVQHDREVVVAQYRVHAASEIGPLVHNFLHNASTIYRRQAPNHAEMIAEYLSVISCSGLVAFLVRCYLSNCSSHHTKANQALRYLLWPHFQLSNIAARIVEVWTVPLCVEVCRRIASSPGRGKNDQLYKFSRLRMAIVFPLLRENPSSRHLSILPQDWLIEQLTPFAQEKAHEVIGYIVKGSTLPIVDLYEFKVFFVVLCWAVRSLRIGSPSGIRAGEPQQIVALSTMAMSLLNAVNVFMERLARDLPPVGPWSEFQLSDWPADDLVDSIWDVLTKLAIWSKMDGHVASAMRDTLVVHRAPLNMLVLSISTARCLRGDGIIRWIVSNHKDLLGFEARRHLAMAMLPEMDEVLGRARSPHSDILEMLIDRKRLLSDSFSYVMEATHDELRSGLDVEFIDEEATGRGVRKEWLTLVSQALFNPQQGLFLPCPRDGQRFFLNPAPAADPLHLQYLNFAGRIIGLALTHKVQVGIYLDRTLFLQLAGRAVTLNDIADADPTTLASCKKILEMDPDVVDSLGLTFAREVEVLWSRKRKTVDLVPGGRDMAVDGTNRCLYIALLIQDLFLNSTKDALDSFAQGFARMLLKAEWQQDFFQGLDPDDFDKMLGGSKDALDVEDWRSHTVLDEYSEEDDQIKWFWMAVEGMTEEQRRRLLSFWTSRECLPFGGFGGLGLYPVISRAAHATSDHLPSSNTCVNRLNLPCYNSLGMTQSRLAVIVQEHLCTGFGSL